MSAIVRLCHVTVADKLGRKLYCLSYSPIYVCDSYGDTSGTKTWAISVTGRQTVISISMFDQI